VAHKVLRNEQRNDANHRRSPVQHFTVRLEDGKLSALVKVVLRKLRRDGAQSRDGDDERHQREVLRVDDVRRDARNHLRREEQLEGFFLRDDFTGDGGDEADHSRASVDELRGFRENRVALLRRRRARGKSLLGISMSISGSPNNDVSI
jgi:hypothetical protein